jgi:hypothetical protein
MLLPFLLAVSAQTVSADIAPPNQASDEAYVINDVWADKAKCNSDTAKRVQLKMLVLGFAELLGQCVSVSGYLSGRALFLSKPDSKLRYSNSTGALKMRRLGLYGLNKVSPGNPPKAGSYEIVGTVGDCERLGSDAMMVMGYCHYTNGPYIAVSELRQVK